MKTSYRDFEIDDDLSRIDFARVHGWLTNSYWSPGISREKVEKAARHTAVVIGVYAASGEQVGYGRVVSDTVRFSYMADIYVEGAHRGKGIGRAICRFAQEHPILEDVGWILLATKDAHGVYAGAGFEPLAQPDKWMRWKRSPDSGGPG
jgi:ribosomal protein S18 acetylase RimI-like enzyme